MSPVQRRGVQGLPLTAGPANLDPVNAGTIAETEVHGPGRLRKIAAGRLDLADHDVLAGIDLHQGADGVAVAPRAAQAKDDVVPARQSVLSSPDGVNEIEKALWPEIAALDWGATGHRCVRPAIRVSRGEQGPTRPRLPPVTQAERRTALSNRDPANGLARVER